MKQHSRSATSSCQRFGHPHPEALILARALLVCGVIVRNVTRSAFAAMLFQVAPFVNPVMLHYELMQMPEGLVVRTPFLEWGLVLKAALNENRPAAGLGAAQGLTFALGMSSKYLYPP